MQEAKVGAKDNIFICPSGHGPLFMENDVTAGLTAVCYVCGFESHHDPVKEPGEDPKTMRKENRGSSVRYPEAVQREAVRRYNAGERPKRILADVGCGSATLNYWRRKYAGEIPFTPASALPMPLKVITEGLITLKEMQVTIGKMIKAFDKEMKC